MIRGKDHTSISTSDLDRLLDFYVSLVGLQHMFAGNWQDDPSMDKIVDLKNTEGRKAMLSVGTMFLELFEYHKPAPEPNDSCRRTCDPALTLVCFDVVDVEYEYQRLSNAGVLFLSPPRRTPSVHGFSRCAPSVHPARSEGSSTRCTERVRVRGEPGPSWRCLETRESFAHLGPNHPRIQQLKTHELGEKR